MAGLRLAGTRIACCSLIWLAISSSAQFAARLFGEEPTKSKAKHSHLPFTISKETTFVTEPVRKDGTIDYAAAENAIYGKGVTPETNACVKMLQAFGPKCIDTKSREKYVQFSAFNRFQSEAIILLTSSSLRGQISMTEVHRRGSNQPSHGCPVGSKRPRVTALLDHEGVSRIGEVALSQREAADAHHCRSEVPRFFEPPPYQSTIGGSAAAFPQCRKFSDRRRMRLAVGQPSR